MYVDRRLLRTKFLPLFVQWRWRKVGITFGRLMKFSRCVTHKRKIPPKQRSDGFCRGESAAKWIGCVARRLIFQGWSTARQCSKWTRPHFVGGFKPIHKNGGIYKKNTTVCRIRQEGFGKFIEVKQKKYDTSCGFRKTRYVNQNKTHLPFALNPSTASCNRILLMHSRRRLQ